MNDWKKLRELAEALGAVPRDSTFERDRLWQQWRDAANPQTVIALLDEVERLRGSRDGWHERACKDARALNESVRQLAAANAECAALNAQIDNINRVRACQEQQLTAMTAARDEACDIAADLVNRTDGLGTDEDLAAIAALRKVGAQ